MLKVPNIHLWEIYAYIYAIYEVAAINDIARIAVTVDNNNDDDDYTANNNNDDATVCLHILSWSLGQMSWQENVSSTMLLPYLCQKYAS